MAVNFPDSPINGQTFVSGGITYTWNGTAWGVTGSGVAGPPGPQGPAGSVTISDTAPVSPHVGDLWFDSVGMQIYIWYNDGSSSQWVSVVAQPGSGGSGATSAPGQGGPPTISGTGVVGQTLTAATGAWTNLPDSYAYQWKRGGAAISGATSATYVLQSADGNTAITCTVTATNSIGSGSQTTNAINVLPAFVFPTGMQAIYSTRLVVNGYAGSCLTVRRMWDNTTANIGFVGSNLDVASAVAFLKDGSGNTVQGFVEAWFDQSGNGNHAVQTTSTPSEFRPSLLVIGQRAYITFEGQILNTSAQVGANGDQTIGYVGWSGDSGAQQIPVANFDGTNGWFLQANGGPKKGVGYYSVGSGGINATSGNMMAVSPLRTVVTRTSGAVAFRMNGAALTGTGTGASNAVPSNGMGIGGYNLTNPSWQGMLAEVYVYASALSTTVLNQIDTDESVYFPDLGFTTPYASGTGVVQLGVNDTISFGNVLQYDQGQPWTAWGVVQLWGQNSNAEVLFTNATTDSRAVCYEYWIDANGQMRVRLIHNYGGAQYLGVFGKPPGGYLIDGKKHLIAATYDGTNPATMASIKMYVDGVLLTNTLELNGLGSLSIVDPAQNFAVGTQMPGGSNVRGPLCFFQLDNVARSAAYIANYYPGASTPLPPSDANTKMRVMFSEGAGTVVHDTSSNAFTGTLSTAGAWVP